MQMPSAKDGEAMKPAIVYTKEEILRDLQTYHYQVHTSEEFDADYFPSLDVYYGMITPLTNPNAKSIREWAQLALEGFNEDYNSKYELVDVLKGTTSAAGNMLVTFEGKDDNADCKIFLGVVFVEIPEPDGTFFSCILKPDE